MTCRSRLFLLLALLVIPWIHADPTCAAGDDVCQEEEEECRDSHEMCLTWAKQGECKSSTKYMKRYCPKSCNHCVVVEKQETKKNLVDTSWGVPQDVSGSHAPQVRDLIQKTHDYMVKQVYKEDRFDEVREECLNRHELCAFWAVLGECEANPKYMALNCAPSCQSCELISFETRCPYDKSAPTALQKEGDLNAVFERILTLPHYQQYHPQVYSQPNPSSPDIHEGPWLVTLDNFLSPSECQRLIDLGDAQGYERSADVGQAKFDGTFDSHQNEGRTSTNAWCTEECVKDATTRQIQERMENLTGIPQENYEYLQMLRYTVGQYYRVHHDYIEHHLERSEGVRVLTLFLYLNNVEEGGGTNFPLLNVTIVPKVGRAVLWPSVLNHEPNAKDGRTTHQALPVIRGIKYGANAWIHQRDFKEPYSRSCH